MEFHSFCAFSSSESKTKSSRHKFDLAATRPVSDAPASDGRSLYPGDPMPDWSDDNGNQMCSQESVGRSAGITDHGILKDAVRGGIIKGDAVINGREFFKPDAAKDAAKRLTVYAAVKSAVKNNRRPVATGHAL